MILLAALIVIAGHWYNEPGLISPDGTYYLRSHAARPAPYSRRWLLPLLLGQRVWAWRLATFAAITATACMMPGIWGALLFLGLPGLVWLNIRFPVLVDAVALSLALGAARAWESGHHALALVLVALSGACAEKGPVFAAIYAMHPVLLLGLLAVNWERGAPGNEWWLQPIHKLLPMMRKHHAPFDWRTMLAPWGSLVVLVPLGGFTLQAGVALAAGYGQLLIATDRARLYQWAAPVLIPLAVHAPPSVLAAAVVLHMFNPWRGL